MKDLNEMTLPELQNEKERLESPFEFVNDVEKQLGELRLGYVIETMDAIKNSPEYITSPPTARTEKWTLNMIKEL